MKKISYLIISLLLISTVSAITIYSGEQIEIELEKPYEYYSIVGNSTEVILDIIQNGNNVTITPNKYSVNDSYEIIFFDINKEVIVNHYSGGGGTKTVYVDKNITQFVPRDVIKEVVKEVPGDTIINEVEKPVSKFPYFWIGAIVILIGIIIYLIFFRKDTIERGYD